MQDWNMVHVFVEMSLKFHTAY